MLFVRICVEIDISAPPTEEIVLNMFGKEFRQKVVWDRIPLYCSDCKHVGYVRDACYAFGKKVKQAKRDYTSVNKHRWPSQPPRQRRQIWQPRSKEVNIPTSNVFPSLAREEEVESMVQTSCTNDGNTRVVHPPNQLQVQEDNDGFQLVARRKGKGMQHNSHSGQGSGANGGTALVVGAIKKLEAAPCPPSNEDCNTSESEDELMIEEVKPGGQSSG